MFTWAIICSIGLVGFGIAGVVSIIDDAVKAGSACAVIYGVLLAVATLLYYLVSPTACFGCGVFLTVTTCALIGTQFFVSDDIANKHKEVRAAALAMSTANFACVATSYLIVGEFFAFAISLVVILVFAVLNIGISFEYEIVKVFHVLNIAFATIALAGMVVGFSLNAKIEKGVTVQTTCRIYKYDDFNSAVGGGKQSELSFNESYAMQLTFDWQNLMAYTTDSEKIRIQVTLPAAADYVSEGVGFTSENKKVWTYDFELNSLSNSRLKSGYFIFNYPYSATSIPIQTFNVRVGTPPTKNATQPDVQSSKYFKAYERNFRYTFQKRGYVFTTKNCIKDLSQADDGYYRITPPSGCDSLRINFYNPAKSGLYCSETVRVSDGYYLLDIAALLEQGVSDGVYEKIRKNKDGVVVEITAVGKGDYADTSFAFDYCFVSSK